MLSNIWHCHLIIFRINYGGDIVKRSKLLGIQKIEAVLIDLLKDMCIPIHIDIHGDSTDCREWHVFPFVATAKNF